MRCNVTENWNILPVKLFTLKHNNDGPQYIYVRKEYNRKYAIFGIDIKVSICVYLKINFSNNTGQIPFEMATCSKILKINWCQNSTGIMTRRAYIKNFWPPFWQQWTDCYCPEALSLLRSL